MRMMAWNSSWCGQRTPAPRRVTATPAPLGASPTLWIAPPLRAIERSLRSSRDRLTILAGVDRHGRSRGYVAWLLQRACACTIDPTCAPSRRHRSPRAHRLASDAPLDSGRRRRPDTGTPAPGPGLDGEHPVGDVRDRAAIILRQDAAGPGGAMSTGRIARPTRAVNERHCGASRDPAPTRPAMPVARAPARAPASSPHALRRAADEPMHRPRSSAPPYAVFTSYRRTRDASPRRDVPAACPAPAAAAISGISNPSPQPL